MVTRLRSGYLPARKSSPREAPLPIDPDVPVLETERLCLTLTGPEQAGLVLAFFQENQAHLERWGPPFPPAMLTLEHWQANADKLVEQWRAGTAVKFSVLTAARDEVVGTVSLFDLRRQIWQNGSLGYALAARHQGQGLMSEAVRAATAFAFETLGLHRVEAAIVPRNRASRRVAEKLGMRDEGTAVRFLQIQGVYEDHVRYAMTAEEWDERGHELVARFLTPAAPAS